MLLGAPCQTFTVAGNGAGRRALDDVLIFKRMVAREDMSEIKRDLAKMDDERTGLILEPLRWALEAIDKEKCLTERSFSSRSQQYYQFGSHADALKVKATLSSVFCELKNMVFPNSQTGGLYCSTRKRPCFPTHTDASHLSKRCSTRTWR